MVGSTHSVLEGSDSFPDGLVVVARRQNQGRGRSGNVWMSPEGCAMFSLRMQFSLQSELGRHLSIFQHIVALATVLAAKKLPRCQVRGTIGLNCMRVEFLNNCSYNFKRICRWESSGPTISAIEISLKERSSKLVEF